MNSLIKYALGNQDATCLCWKIRHRNARVDGRALRRFGSRFLPRYLQHFGGARAWNEAHSGIVGEDDIARGDTNPGNFDLAVDLDGLDTPFAGDGSYLRRPYGIADAARMSDIADAAENDSTAFALALGGLRGNTPMFEIPATPSITTTSPGRARL